MILTDITLISADNFHWPISLADIIGLPYWTQLHCTQTSVFSPSVFFTFSMWSWWCRTLSGCSRWPEPRSPRLLSGCHGRFCPAGVSSGAVVRRGRVSVDKANIDEHRGKSKSARTAAIPKSCPIYFTKTCEDTSPTAQSFVIKNLSKSKLQIFPQAWIKIKSLMPF